MEERPSIEVSSHQFRLISQLVHKLVSVGIPVTARFTDKCIKELPTLPKGHIHYPFQVLVILIPASRASDDNLNRYLRLFDKATKDGQHVTPQYIASLSLDDLTELMRPLGRQNMNAANLKLTADILLRKRQCGVIQRTDYDFVCGLPGVGPKVTSLTFLAAFDFVLVCVLYGFVLLCYLFSLLDCYSLIAIGTWCGLSCHADIIDLGTL